MATSLDSLQIEIVASCQRATTAIAKLTTQLGDLSTALGRVDSKNVNSLGDALGKVTENLSNIGGSNGVKTIQNMANNLGQVSAQTKSLNETSQAIGKVAEEANKSSAGLQKTAKDAQALGNASTGAKNISDRFKELNKPLRDASNEIGIFKSKAENLKIVAPTGDLEKVRGKIKRLQDQYDELRKKIEFKSSDEYSGTYSDKAYSTDVANLAYIQKKYEDLILTAKNLALSGDGFTTSKKAVKAVGDVFKNTGSNIAAMGKGIGKFLFNFSQIPRMANLASKALHKFSMIDNKLVKSLGRTVKMLRLMVTRMTLRQVIDKTCDGFKNFAQYSDTFNASLSLLWNSFRQLGNSIASMVAPALNALAPILNNLIGYLIEACNWVNQLLSALTGATTWSRAKKLNDDYAKSLDKSNKSANKLKKTVLGFDELNQLQDKDSGGGLTSPADMFEDLPVNSKFEDIKNWLKDMWDMKDFTELGAKLGQKLKDWLDAIPWDRIRQTSNDLGKCVATFINGLTEIEGLGYAIGNALAQALNTVFEFINGFVHNLHWDSVGKFIADTFNGFFEGIDWDLIQDTVHTGMQGIVDAVNSFIKDFHWDNISDFISNSINTLSDALSTIFGGGDNEGIDFEALGFKLGQQLKATIDKIDWEQLGEALGSIVQSAINFVEGFLDGSDGIWTSIKNAIQLLLEGFFKEVDKDKLAGIVATIVAASLTLSVGKILAKEAIKRLGESILNRIFVGAATKTVATTAATEVSGALLGTATAPTVTSAIATLGNVLGIGLAVAIGAKLGEGLAHIIGDISGDEYYKNFSLFGDDDYGFFKNVKDFFQMKINPDSFTAFSKVLADIKEGAKVTEGELERLQNRYDWNDGQLKLLKTTMEQVQKPISDTANNAKEAADKIGSVSDKVKEVSNGMGEMKTGTDKVNAALDSTKDGVKKYMENMDKIPVYTKQGTDSVKPILDDFQKDFESKLAGIEVKETAMNIGRDVTGGVAEGMKETDTTEPSKNFFQKLWDSIKSVFGIASPAKEMYPLGNYITLGIIEGFKEKFDEFTKTAKDFLDNFVKPAFSKDKWTLEGIREGLKASFEGAIDAVKQVWNRFANWLNESVKIDIEPIEIMGNRVFDGAHFQLFHLPTFATGGFPEDGLFMANHGEMVGKFSNGKTAVANNEQITDGIAKAVYSAIMNANASSGNSGNVPYINNTIQVDGETIARAVTKGQQSLNRRYSPSGAY